MACAADIGAGPLPVFPMLMRESTWQRAPTQVYRPIFSGVRLTEIPVVALAYLIPTADGGPPQRAYIRTERVAQLGKTVADFEQEALHNLSVRRASWSSFAPGPGQVFAMCTDDYLAAERVLDGAFLRQAHAIVGDHSMVMGIPARGQLYAAPFSTFAHTGRAFVMMMQKMFAEAGDLAITPRIFTVIQGALNNVLEVG